MWFVVQVEDMLFVELEEGMLFMELTEVEDGWLWRSGMTGSMPEVGFGRLNKLVVKKVKDKMGNIVGGEESIAWCDWLLGVRIAAKVVQNLAPFFFLIQER
jgi:hypothetical protein